MGAQITNLAAARKGPNCIISDCCIHWRELGGSVAEVVVMVWKCAKLDGLVISQFFSLRLPHNSTGIQNDDHADV
jgi:hypothetical protein